MFKRLVPLGSWCRTSYQCRVHASSLGLQQTRSTPFDWTVTPFRSLTKIIRLDLEEDLLLNSSDSYVNSAGSITCGYSGISFHHDLSPNSVRDAGGKPDDQEVPSALVESREWADAKNRFLHTLGNVHETFKEEKNLYVRWMRTGRGSAGRFPGVFDGEAPLKILELLSSCGYYKSSGLLHICTKVVEGVQAPLTNPIKSITEIGENCWECVLLERKGFNGDQTSSFKGDKLSWNKLFRDILASAQHRAQ